jgi:hypothetical protein
MMNLNQNVADKAAAANTELNAARHRITALDSSVATRAANVQRARIKLGRLTSIEEEPGQQKTLTAFIASETATIASETDERERIQGSMQALMLRAGALAKGAEMARAAQSGTELEAARAAWSDAITPHLAVAERLRAAVKAAGMYCLIPADADLLSGGGKRPINV